MSAELRVAGVTQDMMQVVSEKLLDAHAIPAAHDVEEIASSLAVSRASQDEDTLHAMLGEGLVELCKRGQHTHGGGSRI